MSCENFADPVERIPSAVAGLSQESATIHGLRVKIVDGTVKSVKNLTYDTYALVVQVDPGEDFAVKAGQYGAIWPQELDLPRAYSFARAPQTEAPGQHTFFVRLVPDGRFSNWLKGGEKRVGEKVTLSGPMGKFGLDPSSDPVICIAGGSGMSAIFAILEDAGLRRIERDALFLYGARAQKDLYCLDRIAAIKKNWHPDYQFEFVPVLSEEPEASDWNGARGFVTEYFKENYIDSGKCAPGGAKAFFCGPPPMIDSGIEVLTSAGMPAANIFYDKFEDASSPPPRVDNSKCVLCDECLLVKPIQNCIVELASLKQNGNGEPAFTKLSPSKTTGLYYTTLYVDQKECIRCYACVDVCPTGAIHPQNTEVNETLSKVIIDG